MFFFATIDKCFISLAIFLLLVKTIPPLPAVIILLPLKLKQPTLPNVPQCLFLYLDPKD